MVSSPEDPEIEALYGKLESAKQCGLTGATQYYRRQIAALEAERDEDEDPDKAELSPDPEAEAALSAEERTTLEQRRNQAQKMGMDGAAAHYERQLNT